MVWGGNEQAEDRGVGVFVVERVRNPKTLVELGSVSDSRSTDSARDAKRIMTRAFRMYKKDHPDTSLTTEKAIGTVSTYPIRERIETGKVSALYSEGLAESVMKIVGQKVDRRSFLWYVEQSLRKELA